MCRHRESSDQSCSSTTLSSFLWLNRTLCIITWQYTPLEKRKKITVHRRKGSMLLVPLPLASRDGSSVNLDLEYWWVCTKHMITVYTLLVEGKDCCRRGCILKHCVRDELTRTIIFLSKISTPFLTFLIPYLSLLRRNSYNKNPQNFQTPLSAVNFFSTTCVRILNNVFS